MSAAAEARDLCLSNIVHGAFVEVAEEGTQAGAVTVVVAMVPVSKVRRPPPPIFRADHPFLFCIRDNQTSAILFIGRVFRP